MTDKKQLLWGGAELVWGGKPISVAGDAPEAPAEKAADVAGFQTGAFQLTTPQPANARFSCEPGIFSVSGQDALLSVEPAVEDVGRG